MEPETEQNAVVVEQRGSMIVLAVVVVFALLLATAALAHRMPLDERPVWKEKSFRYGSVIYCLAEPLRVSIRAPWGQGGLLRHKVFRDDVYMGRIEVGPAPEGGGPQGLVVARTSNGQEVGVTVRGEGEQALLFRYVLDTPNPERSALFARIFSTAEICGSLDDPVR
jgi:hypothetical protein